MKTLIMSALLALADQAMASAPSSTSLGAPPVPEVATTAATPASTGRPPGSVRRPSPSTRWVGRAAARMAASSGAGAAISSGRTASPASQAAVTAPTATGRGMTTATSAPEGDMGR